MTAPTIWWVRKEFRLGDNPALTEALERGGPVIPVVILDPETEALGAAPKWRLHQAIRVFDAALRAAGSRLILRRGPALDMLRHLVEETGADTVVWGRHYDAEAKARDSAVKAALKQDGVAALSVRAHLLIEPWEIETKSGGPYKVYSPFKRACFERCDPGDPLPAPGDLAAPESWPESDALGDWRLEAPMNRGAAALAEYAQIGEQAAARRLSDFLEVIGAYKSDRDRLDRTGTSRLSEHLAWGEIGPATSWHAAREAMQRDSAVKEGGRTFLQELLWREFAYHLLHHYPDLPRQNWRGEWDAFPWREDNDDAERWRRGMTGLPLVDAAMRELYTTGYMHNRMRMLTASVLTKHLMTHWRIGEAWFRDCLIDWDPASNAMGWQWSAGSGPDATPYFRIFNPETQRGKFDPDDTYLHRWVAELGDGDSPDAVRFFEAIPRSWDMAPGQPYPEPVIGLAEGRQRALAAYESLKRDGDAA